MNKLKFFFNRIFKMDYKRFSDTLKYIRKASEKPYISLLPDMLACAIRYNAGYMDYKIAHMWELNRSQRKSVITRGISNEIVHKYNDKEAWHFFDNKFEFNRLFKKWVNRDYMYFSDDVSKDELQKFVKGKKSLFVKPLFGSSGVGVEKFEGESLDVDKLYQSLIRKSPAIIEETVIQHEKMASLNPSSVNTLRIATLLGEKKEGIVYGFLRIGNGKVMDNIDCGGFSVKIDMETGRLITPACDKAGNVYKKHPLTGADIIGFEIPYFEEAKQMCLEAMYLVPKLRFVAWDVAITENGPTFIEGNSFPSHAVPQFAAHYPDGYGIMTEFRKFIDI